MSLLLHTPLFSYVAVRYYFTLKLIPGYSIDLLTITTEVHRVGPILRQGFLSSLRQTSVRWFEQSLSILTFNL